MADVIALEGAEQLEDATELMVLDYPTFIRHLVDHYGFTTEEVEALWRSIGKLPFLMENDDGSVEECDVGMVAMIGPVLEGERRLAFLVKKRRTRG